MSQRILQGGSKRHVGNVLTVGLRPDEGAGQRDRDAFELNRSFRHAGLLFQVRGELGPEKASLHKKHAGYSVR